MRQADHYTLNAGPGPSHFPRRSSSLHAHGEAMEPQSQAHREAGIAMLTDKCIAALPRASSRA